MLPVTRSRVARSRARRRLLLLVAAVCCLAVTLVCPALAFTDVPAGHPYQEAIEGLAAKGIISGYNAATFGLNDLVKRQQFAKMIVLTMGLTVAEGDFPDAAAPFIDLGPDDTASLYPHEYVAVCARNQITLGKTPTSFDPLSNVTRAQLISMVVRAADKLAPGTLHPPAAGWAGVLDYTDSAHGANIKKAEYNGLLARIQGSNGALAGWNTGSQATRGEVAQVLWNLLDLLGQGGGSGGTGGATGGGTGGGGPPVAGDIWVYSNGTGDYPTIEAALDAIATGATIHLGPGTFVLTETMLVDFSFNLVGSGAAGPQASTVTYAGTVVDVRSVSFSAQQVRFVSSAATAASDVLRAEDAVIDLVDCYLSGGNRVDGDSGDGAYLFGTTTGSVTDCVLTLNDLHGVDVDDEAVVEVFDSTCGGNGQCGIAFWGEAVGTVTGNVCNTNGQDGVSLSEYSDVLVEDNECSYNGYTGVILFDDSTATIRSNTCIGNKEFDGIGLYDWSSAQVEYNLCTNNAQVGINFSDNSSGAARYNECAGNIWGIYVAASSTAVLGPNTLYNNTYNLVDSR